jgi:hypothetical protein
VQVLIALFVAFFFYRDGDRVRRLLLEASARLAGPDSGAPDLDRARRVAASSTACSARRSRRPWSR